MPCGLLRFFPKILWIRIGVYAGVLSNRFVFFVFGSLPGNEFNLIVLVQLDDFIGHQLFHPLPFVWGVVHSDGFLVFLNTMAQPWRLDHALEHFLDLIQKRHYEGWELVQAQLVWV